MTIKYYSDVDMLNIKLVEPPYDYSEGQEADPDIVLHFDTANRLLEIEIEHASKRVNLEQLRELAIFKEVQQEGEMATVGKDHLRSQDHATGRAGALPGSRSKKPSRV